MDDIAIGVVGLVLLTCVFVLPIWTLVRTRKIGQLEQRIQGLEAAVWRLSQQGGASAPRPAEAPPPDTAPPAETETPPGAGEQAPAPVAPAAAAADRSPAWAAPLEAPSGRKWEEIIGERWLGWLGISALLFGAAFFLKYAFDNRWIGELGRVMIGVAGGLGLLWFGWRRRVAGWTTFSQVFTAGGVALLYLSVYASYGFYQLLPAAAAFAFLALIVVQTHLLAVAYRAPAIALMGQIGGFLTPVLLSTGRDQYVILFSYLALLAAGAVLVAALRDWGWIAATSLALTHLLYWAWYGDNYHPEKAWAAALFQLAVWAIFLGPVLIPARRGRPLQVADWISLFLNAIAAFGALYVILDDEAPGWAGAAAIVAAALYAGLAQWGLGLPGERRRLSLALVGVALLFITLAIPIQLEADWIALAWAVMAASLAWLAARLGGVGWLWGAGALAILAILGFLVFEIDRSTYFAFTPVFNRHFLVAFGIVAAFGAGAWFLRQPYRRVAVAWMMAAIVLLWFAGTMEIDAHYDSLSRQMAQDAATDYRSIDWARGMAISVFWAVFAATLVGAGLRLHQSTLRWSGLVLFGLTVLKAGLFDIPMLDGFYRVIALVALGLLLLGAGWAYQQMRAAQKGTAA